MATRFVARTWVRIAGIALAGAFVCGIGGLLVGAWYGGNFASSYEFNGVRGYEAFGQIGLGVGALLGSLIGGAVAKSGTHRLGR